MLFYSDPFKEEVYGKLQGEVSDAWCTLEFDEGQVYRHEENYVLAANFTSLSNVIRSYKPELSIDFPAKAVWTIHSKDYQVRKKNADSGKYESITYKASIHEKLLHQHITDNPGQWLEDGKGIKGKIIHLNNASYEMQGNSHQLPVNSFEIEQISLSGNLPAWTPPKKGSWNGSKGGASLDEKMAFLKKELISSLIDGSMKKILTNNNSDLSCIVREVIKENQDDERFLSIYLNLVGNILK